MSWSKRIPLLSIPKVEENRFLLFILFFTSVILVAPAILKFLDLFSIRTYFLLSFIWLLISSEVFAPADPDTDWWGYVTWLKVIGWVVLVLIVAERVLLAVG